MLINRYQALSITERRAFWIALVMAVIFAIFAGTLLDTLIGAPDLQNAIANSIPFALSITAFSSSALILTGRVASGSYLIQIVTFAATILSVTQAEGYGFPAAFIFIAVTLYIPLQTLKGQQASLALWFGIAGTPLIIVLDTFWPGSRISAVAQDVLTASILSIVLALILIFTTIRQFANYTLRTKLLTLALGTGLVSIIVVAVFTNSFTRRTLLQNTRELLASAASSTIHDIDRFISLNSLAISEESRLPELVSFLKSSSAIQEETNSRVLTLLNELSQRSQEFTTSYALLDRNGINLVGTRRIDIGADFSDQDYFIQPKTTGRVFVSSVEISPTSLDRVFYISAPIIDSSEEFLGVLRVQFPFSYIREIFADNQNVAGEESYAILLDDKDVILIHSTNPDWVSRTLAKPDPETYQYLRINNRIPGNFDIDGISLNLPNFAENLERLLVSEPSFTGTDPAWGTVVEVGAAKSTSGAPFRIVFIMPHSVILEPVARQVEVTVIATILTGLAILFASIFVTRIIVRPFENLAAVVEDISSGNLSARADYPVDDEVGALARSFNHMTSQLQDMLGGLERRVAERTADLETARLLSEQRAQDLHSISEISRAISLEQRLDILLPLITRLVSERFDFYHVGIFFVDEARRYAHLQAANSEGGQRMLARSHRLEIGTGLVGTVAQTAKPRIALDVGVDAVFFNNPDLPNTHSEMALPLNVRGRTIGVLDVQSTSPGAFTENDASTLGVLADQIAIAIENARLFNQTQLAREEAETLYSQIQRQEWNAFIKQGASIGYRQTAIGGRRLAKPVETDEIQHTLRSGQTLVTKTGKINTSPMVIVPIKLRGQTIGVLNIKGTGDRDWNKDELDLIQSVTDRMALALENARLFEETTKRAERERLVSEITGKIRSHNDPQAIIETALQELRNALGASRVEIVPKTNGGKDTKV